MQLRVVGILKKEENEVLIHQVVKESLHFL